MGFKPIGSEDNVVSACGGDVKFGAFLMKVGRVPGFYSDCLDGDRADGAGFVQGAVYVFYGEWGAECSEGQVVSFGKVMVNDHSFGAAVKEGGGTDLLIRFLSDKGHWEGDGRGTYISNGSFGYRIGIESKKKRWSGKRSRSNKTGSSTRQCGCRTI